PTASAPKDATSATSRPVRRPLSAPPPAPPRGALQVRGRVLDARGQPAVGVEVSASVPLPDETLSELPCDTDPAVPLSAGDCDTASAWDWALEMVASHRGSAFVLTRTPSAQDGTFTLEGLPEGTVAVWALGPEGAALEEDVATGTQDLKLVLSPALKLSGRVVDEDGAPLPGTRLTVLHTGNARYFETVADAEGRFAVGPLPQAIYTLAAAHPGKLSTWLQDLGPEALEEDLVLHPPRRIVGQVLDGERPVPGVSVLEQAGDRIAVTDADGRFTFDNLLPSAYSMTVEHDGQRALTQVELTEHQTEAEVTLHLGSAFFVDATVRDTAGHPVRDAVVAAVDQDTFNRGLWSVGLSTSKTQRTDAEGHVRLGPLAERSYRFQVDAERMLGISEERTVGRDAPPLEFVLSPAIIVEGQVVDAQGQPVKEASLSLRAPPEEEPPRRYRIHMHHSRPRTFDATTDDTGHFAIKLDKAMAGILAVEAEGYLGRELQVQAPSSGLQVTLESGATVRGTVTSSSGVPVKDVDVTLTKGGVNEDDPEDHGRVAFAGSTEEDGTFSIRGVPPGNYAVWLQATEGGYQRLMPQRVEVRGSETVEIALHLDLDGRIAGVVVDAQGLPLAGVTVEAVAKEEAGSGGRSYSPLETKTGPDGRFALEPLARDWDYELTATKPGYAMSRPPPAKPEPEPEPDEEDEGSDELLGGLRMGRWEPDEEDPKVIARAGNMAVRVVLTAQSRITGRLAKPNGAPITRFDLNEEPVRDPRGAFTVFVDKPGLQHLSFKAPGHAFTQRDVRVPAGRDVDLGEVRIEAGHTVRGRVVDDATGEPLEGVEISLSLTPEELKAAAEEESGEKYEIYEADGSFLDATTARDGTFTLPSVESRPYRLTARHTGAGEYATLERTLGPTEDRLELRLQGDTRLEVTVKDAQGKPYPVMVSARSQRDQEATDYIPDDDARTVFRELEPGDYLVGLRSGDGPYAAPYQKVRVEAHRVTRVELLAAAKGATVTVRWGERGPQGLVLFFPGTVPLPGSDAATGELRGKGLRTTSGNETWSNVPPGPYTLMVLHHRGHGKWLTYRQDVTVGTAPEQEVQVPTITW
ncbi:carboxypeptidase regulatory-like domain-containing protein, partial [Corallococcus terminator]